MQSTNKLHIMSKNILDEVILSVSTEDADYPLTNLQIPELSSKWRSTTLGDQVICADLVNYQTVSGFSINGHNFSFGSTLDLDLYTSINRDVPVDTITPGTGNLKEIDFGGSHGAIDDGKPIAVHVEIVGGDPTILDATFIDSVTLQVDTTLSIDTTTATTLQRVYTATKDAVVPTLGWGEQAWGLGGWYGYDTDTDRRDYLTVWFDSLFCDFMRVTIADASNTDGYVEAGRIMLGDAFTPTYNFLWGHGIRYASETKLTRTRSGSLISDNRPSYRIATFQLAYMPVDEGMKVLSMMKYPGNKTDSLITMYPDDTGVLGQVTTILGRFVNHDALVRNSIGYTMSVTFEEAL